MLPATLPALFAHASARFASRALLLGTDGREYSYAEVYERVGRTSAALRRLGLEPGGRACLCTDDLDQAALLAWSVWHAGGVLVPVDAGLGPSAKLRVTDHVEPSLVLAGRGSDLPAACRGLRVSLPERDLDSLMNSGTGIEAGNEAFLEPAAPEPAEPALILYTSGTTSYPKGVVLSHGAISASGLLMASHFDWRQDDRYIALGGLHTMSGLRNPCVAVPAAGASLLPAQASARHDLFKAAEVVQARGCTIVGSVPVFYQQAERFNDRLPSAWASSVRQFLCTGSMLGGAQAASFRAKTGRGILDYYGLTETCGLCVAVPPGEAKRGTGDIGYPVQAEARIVDEGGAALGAGERGELWIRSPRLMTGYYRSPEATESRLSGGWLRTADLAEAAPDGRIRLVGRLDDMIKAPGTELLYSGELEEVLSSHPGVAEAGVCAARDAGGVERPAAFVVARPGAGGESLARELRGLAAERMGRFAVPAAVRFVEALPRGAGGKLLRRELEALLREDAP